MRPVTALALFALPLFSCPTLAQKPPAAPPAPAAADFDPFAPLAGLREGEPLPTLRCMKRDVFVAAIEAHDGSKVVEMTPPQEMFWRGFYTAQPFTPPGYPIGDGVVYAVKVVETKEGKSTLAGVAAFTLGEFVVCNALPVPNEMLTMLSKASGAVSKDAY